MTDKGSKLTRRDFMLVGAAAVSAPLLTNLSGLVLEAEAANPEATEMDHLEATNPNCGGCQACTILFSNCHELNGRHCWCKPV